MRFFLVIAFLSVVVYVAVVNVKDWDKGDKEEKGRFRKFLSIFIPSYEAQKKLLVGIVIVMVLIGGANALVYFQDNNKWEDFKGMLERDRAVKTEHVYGKKSGIDLGNYDARANKLFPDLYNEVVRLRSEGGGVQPVLSARSPENEVDLGPGDKVYVNWEVIDENVCDTPVRAYCGVGGGGGITYIGIVDKRDSIEMPVAGSYIMRAFCYVKDDALDYYTLITPRIDLSKTTVSVY